MTQPETAAADVQRWLATIGVASLCEWDILVFLHRHQTILMSPDHLAQLMGYQTSTVLAALDVLAAHELVELSPQSTAPVLLYRRTPPSEPSRLEAVERLIALGEHRSGRLTLCTLLRRGDRSPQQGLAAARRHLENARRVGAIAWRHSLEVRRMICERDEQREPGRNGRPAGEKGPWPRAV